MEKCSNAGNSFYAICIQSLMEAKNDEWVWQNIGQEECSACYMRGYVKPS